MDGWKGARVCVRGYVRELDEKVFYRTKGFLSVYHLPGFSRFVAVKIGVKGVSRGE